MALIVHKYGGTSMGSPERIQSVARRVAKWARAGHQLVVVPSAMSGETNRLLALARQLAPEATTDHVLRELDMIASTGEQVSVGLLSLALQAEGVAAVSYAGWQVPIATDVAYTKARIEKIDDMRVRADLAAGKVVVITGFQGVDPQGHITTLGRGGSDTSAVAIAAALRADECLIYTDVDGVYTTDPRIVEKARKIDKVTYEEMLEMASQGSRVLQTRSVELAMNHHVRVQVLSSFDEAVGSDLPGTLVVDEDEIMVQGIEKSVVSGIAFAKDEAKITVTHVPDRPGVAAAIFGPLAEANINVDMIVQNVSLDGSSTDITFTVPRADLARAVERLQKAKADLKFAEVKADTNVAKVSVIGVGMRSHAGVALKMFETLAAKGINIQVISTSEIKVSVLVAAEYTELAVRALHTAYELDAA
jgi:aspartate kinase